MTGSINLASSSVALAHLNPVINDNSTKNIEKNQAVFQTDPNILVSAASEKEFKKEVNEKPPLKSASREPDDKVLKSEVKILAGKISAKEDKEAADRVAQVGASFNNSSKITHSAEQTKTSSLINKLSDNSVARKVEIGLAVSKAFLNASHVEREQAVKNTQTQRALVMKSNEHSLKKTETLTNASNLTAGVSLAGSIISGGGLNGSSKSNQMLKNQPAISSKNMAKTTKNNAAAKISSPVPETPKPVKDQSLTAKRKLDSHDIDIQQETSKRQKTNHEALTANRKSEAQDVDVQQGTSNQQMVGQGMVSGAQINEGIAKQEAAKEEGLEKITQTDSEFHNRMAGSSNDLANSAKSCAQELMRTLDGASLQEKSFISVKA